MPITPVVRQYGFSTASGALADIVDGDALTGWAPLASRLETYTAPFLLPSNPGAQVIGAKGSFEGIAVGNLNVGASFPCLEFDYGAAIRLASFLLQVETPLTLGAACLLASNNPASGVADVIQSGDQCLGLYTPAQIVSGQVQLTAAYLNDIKGRYIRLLQRTTQ